MQSDQWQNRNDWYTQFNYKSNRHIQIDNNSCFSKFSVAQILLLIPSSMENDSYMEQIKNGQSSNPNWDLYGNIQLLNLAQQNPHPEE